MSKFKITTIIAAIGMTFYTCYVALRGVPSISIYLHSLSGLNRDIFYAFWMYLFLGSVIIAIVGILIQNHTDTIEPKKGFRIITYTLTALLSIWAIGALLPSPVHVEGVPYLYIRFPQNIILLTLATIWLWMLSRENSIGSISMALRFAMIAGACLLSIPISVQFASAISYWQDGEILFLHSWAIGSWLKVLVPTILLCWYSIELFMESR